MSEHSPQSLGRYTIHAELGKGGFATVYRATDTMLEREVALKILKPGWTDDAKAVERFMREAKQASRLKHPNIVTIYDVGQAEGRLFIAMELVRGRSLQQIIAADGAMAWSRVLSILEQSAAALDYAHKQGLIHRDIKPANIILDETEPGAPVHAILTDFGLVRGAEQASLSMGSTGGLLGTPEYMAPEIWDGNPATAASDIYALGCVAYFLLTGKILFGATTPVAVLKQHVEGPAFPQQWPSGVPIGVEAVLRRALAKDPNQRAASAAELAAELRASEGQATREKAAREQEASQQAARQKEEAERAAQVALAAEAARRAEEERQRKEAEDRAAIAAQEKAKREAEAAPAVTASAAAQPKESMPAATKVTPPAAPAKSKVGIYVVGAVVVIALIAVVALIGGNRGAAPASAPVMPTAAPVMPTEAHQAANVGVTPQAPTPAQSSSKGALTTATAPAQITRLEEAKNWSVVFADTFSVDNGDWDLTPTDNKFTSIDYSITGGKYRWDVTSKQGVNWWHLPNSSSSFSDFYAAVDARRVSGPQNGEYKYGLSLRADNGDNFYFTAIQNDDSLIATLKHNGQWTTLKKWSAADAIRSDQANRLAVIAQGARLTFFINDQYVGEVHDTRLSSGSIGIGIDLANAGDKDVFEFDNFEIRSPSAGQ